DTVLKEPRRLVADLQNAVELVSRNALLAARHEIDGLEHLVERHTAMLEHGADLYRELLAALAALFQAVADCAFRRLARRLAAHALKRIDATSDDAAMRA